MACPLLEEALNERYPMNSNTWMASVLLMAACGGAPSTGVVSEEPVIGKTDSAGGSAQADKDCRVVLRTVGQDLSFQHVGQYDAIVWTGTLDVRDDVVSQLSGAPEIGFFTNFNEDPVRFNGQWTVLPATPSATPAVSGFHRYDFLLDRNTVRSGSVDGATWNDLIIQVIPLARIGTTTWFDHNFNNPATTSNPNSNYYLTYQLNDFKYASSNDVCPAR